MGRDRVETSRARRGWRGGMLASCSAALAVVAHGAAGGEVPDTAVAVVLTALVAWAGSSLAWTRYGMPAVLGVLGLSQLGMHMVMSGMSHGLSTSSDPVLMFTTHALATVAATWLLLRADATLHVLETAVAHLRGLVRVVYLAGVTGPAPVLRLRPSSRNRVLLDVLLRRVRGRRGPPSFS